jgi:hypothetical protein
MPQQYYPKMWEALEMHLAQILKPDNSLSPRGLTSLLKAFSSNQVFNKDLEDKIWHTYEARFRDNQIDPTLVAMILIVAAKSTNIDFI